MAELGSLTAPLQAGGGNPKRQKTRLPHLLPSLLPGRCLSAPPTCANSVNQPQAWRLSSCRRRQPALSLLRHMVAVLHRRSTTVH